MVPAGCAGIREELAARSANEGQLSLFLNGPKGSELDLTFTMDEVDIQDGEGNWITLARPNRTINSKRIVGRQIALGEWSLPRGRYVTLLIKISKPYLTREGKVADLSFPAQGIPVDIAVEIAPRQSTSLFLSWEPDQSVVQNFLFQPQFSLRTERPELKNLLLYVTNSDSGNVSLVNRATGEVVGVIAVGSQPQGIAASSRGDRIYVANAGSQSISVIDVPTNKVFRTVNLEFGCQPAGLALTPDGRSLLVTCPGNNSVRILDTLSFSISPRIDVGSGPTRAVVTADGRTAFILNKLSNDVSVVDLTGRQVTATIRVESSPSGLALDDRNGRLYVANSGSDTLSVISTSSLQVTDRIAVGPGAVAVASDPIEDRLAVLLGPSRTIVFVDRRLGVRISSTTLPRAGTQLEYDPDGRLLYVVASDSDSLLALDRISGQVQRVIAVGRRPYDLVSVGP